MPRYARDACSAVNQHVPLGERVSYKAVGLLEVWSHPVGGDIQSADGLVVDAVLFVVADAQHCSGGEDCMGG